MDLVVWIQMFVSFSPFRIFSTFPFLFILSDDFELNKPERATKEVLEEESEVFYEPEQK